MEKMRVNNKYLKILSIVAFIFIIMCLIVIMKIPSSKGYELSIYSVYGSFFWFTMTCCVIASVGTIVLSAFFKSKYWITGLISLLVAYNIIFFLPIIRGYAFFSRGDSDLFYHLKELMIISETGYLSRSLIYPMTHILTSILNSLTGLDIIYNIVFLNSFIYVLYILSFYSIGKVIFFNNRGSIFLLALSSPLMLGYLHYAFYPYFFSLSLFPLIVYCFIKGSVNKNITFVLLNLILIFSVVFYHPLVTLMLMVVFAVFQMFYFSKKRFLAINIQSILVVSFVTWYFSFGSLLKKINDVINSIFYPGETTTVFEYQISQVESSEASLLLIVDRFIKMYGSSSIYLFLSLICLIFIFKKWKAKSATNFEIISSMQFIAAMLFGCVQLFGYLVVVEPFRVISFPLIMATLLCGVFLSESIENSNSDALNKSLTIVVICIICFSSVVGIFNLYESPWKGVPSKHMSLMETQGIDWYLHYSNYSYPLMIKYSSIRKYASYKSNSTEFEYLIHENHSIPSHFGYSNSTKLVETFGSKEVYLITNELNRQAIFALSEDRRQRLDQYTKEDFEFLNRDSSVIKIYVNRELEVWKTLV